MGRRISTRKKKKKMIDALVKHMGIVFPAAKEVGIDRATHSHWMAQDPNYKKAVDSIAETVLDYGEAALMDCVKQKEFPAIKYLLSCKGKQRGYIERTAIEVTPPAEKPDIPNSIIADTVNNAIQAELLRLKGLPAPGAVEVAVEPAASPEPPKDEQPPP